MSYKPFDDMDDYEKSFLRDQQIEEAKTRIVRDYPSIESNIVEERFERFNPYVDETDIVFANTKATNAEIIRIGKPMNKFTEAEAREIFYNRLDEIVTSLDLHAMNQGRIINDNTLNAKALDTAYRVVQNMTAFDTGFMFRLKGGTSAFENVLIDHYQRLRGTTYIPETNPDKWGIRIVRGENVFEQPEDHRMLFRQFARDNIEMVKYFPESVVDSYVIGEKSSIYKEYRRNVHTLRNHVANYNLTGKDVDYIDRVDRLDAAINNQVKEPTNYIYSHLYKDPMDVGNFYMRIPDEDFYTHNQLARYDEAIYHYTQNAVLDDQMNHVVMNAEEEVYQRFLRGESVQEGSSYLKQISDTEFMRQWTSTHQIDALNTETLGKIGLNYSQADIDDALNGNNGATFRNFVVNVKEAADTYTTLIKADRETIKTMHSIIREGSKADDGIYTVLQSDAYKNTDIAKSILQDMNDYKNTHNAYGLTLIRNMLMENGEAWLAPITDEKGVTKYNRGRILHQPVYLASSLTKINPETGSMKHFTDELGRIMNDMYNADSKTYALFQQMRNVQGRYYNMMGQMYEGRKAANSEGALYVGEDRSAKEKTGLLDFDEANNIYNESVRHSRIIEQNAEAYERHVQAIENFIENGKEQPVQPMTLFRNEIAKHYVTTDSVLAQQSAADTTRMFNRLFDADDYLDAIDGIYEDGLKSSEFREYLDPAEYLNPYGPTVQSSKGQMARTISPVSQRIDDAIAEMIENIGDKTLVAPTGSNYEKFQWIQEHEKRLNHITHINGKESKVRYASDYTERILTGSKFSWDSAESVISESSYDKMKTAWADFNKGLRNGDDPNALVTHYADKGVNENRREIIRAAQDANRRLRVQGSSIAYRISDVTDDVVTLAREEIDLSSVRLQLDIDVNDREAMRPLYDKIDDRNFREINKDEYLAKQMVDAAYNEGFIEIKYTQSSVNETLKERSQFLYDRMKAAERRIVEDGNLAYTTEIARVGKDDLLRHFNDFRVDVSETAEQGIRKQLSLPRFMMNMVESHAPWMLGRNDELMSRMDVALRQVLDDMSKNGSFVDLTDQGMMNHFSKTATAQLDEGASLPARMVQGAKKYADDLPTMGLADRLNDFLFMRVLRETIQESFHPNGANPHSDGIVNLIKEAKMGATMHEGQALATEIHAILRDANKSGFFATHGSYYSDALKLSPEQIEEIVRDMSSSETSTISLNQMQDRYNIDEDSYEYHNQNRDTVLYDHENYKDKGSGFLQGGETQGENLLVYNDGNPEDILEAKYHREEAAEYLKNRVIDWKRDKGLLDLDENGHEITELTETDYNEYYRSLRESRLNVASEALQQGTFSPKSVTDVETMLGIAEAKGQEYINATVNGQEARIYRGTKGELITELLRERRNVGINEGTAKTMQFKVNNFYPQTFSGEAVITEDIGHAGVPMREQFISHDSLQGSGSFKVPSNPSVTMGEMQKFLEGKRVFTYLDIETTGLQGQLADDLLQPLEVYMQKVQWDTDAGEMRTNEAGEYTVKRRGAESVREMQLIMPLEEKPREHLQNLVNNESFTFQVGEKTYNLVDYDNPMMRGQIDAEINALPQAPAIRTEIYQKQVDFGFLKNVAKYAFNGDLTDDEMTRIGQYANSIDVPTAFGANYIKGLKEDAIKAADMLDAAARGEIQYSNVQVATSRENLVKHVLKFAGKDTVIGQNIANADWQKFIDIAQTRKESIVTEIGNAEQGIYDSAVDGLKKRISAHAEALEVGFKLDDVREAKRQGGASYDDILEDLPYYDRSKGGVEWTMELRRGLSPESKTRRAIRMAAVAAKTMEMDELKDPMSIAIKQMGEFDELVRRLTIDDVKNKKPKFTLEDIKKDPFLSTLVDFKPLNKLNTQLKAVNKEIDHLSSQKLVEEMYLYDLANPNSARRNSETILSHFGITPEEGDTLHIAKTDVKTHIRAVERMGQEMADNEEFQKFARRNKPLKAGDIVELHKAPDKFTPRGIYTVDNIDLENNRIDFSEQLPDNTRKTYSMYGASGTDFANRVESHFTYLGNNPENKRVQRAITDYGNDEARRNIDRAIRNADVFDKYLMENNELHAFGNLEYNALNNMRGVYETQVKPNFVTGGQVLDDPEFTPTTTAQRVAMNNAGLFEGNGINDLLEEKTSNRQRAVLPIVNDWANSFEGKQRKSFLDDVRALQASGAIDHSQKTDIIKQWNEAIKAKGLELGAKRSVTNKANLGTLDSRFRMNGPIDPNLEGMNFVLDTSSASRAEQGIWSLAERARHLFNEPDEVQAKKNALNQLVLPYLRDNGYIQGWEGEPPRVASAARQIMNNKDIEMFEEYDHLKSASMSNTNADYQAFMEQKRAELLEPVMENMSGAQKERFANYGKIVEELKNENRYDPRLKIRPQAEAQDLVTMSMSNTGGLANVNVDKLTEWADIYNTGRKGDEEVRRVIYGELFNRATGGQQINPDDLFEPNVDDRGRLVDDTLRWKGGDTDQLRAMKSLGWVNPDGTYNLNISEHYHGVPGRYASTKLGMMPLNELNRIADDTTGEYTRGNGKTTVKHKIEGWRDRGYEGRSLEAPDRAQAEYVEAVKEAGEIKKEQRAVDEIVRTQDTVDSVFNDARPIQTYDRYPIEAPDSTYMHTNIIDDQIKRAKNTVTNLATDLWNNTGMSGKALKWVAGLGLAAYAINQFMQAGSPIKLERKPMGHGVEGTTGQKDDSHMNQGTDWRGMPTKTADTSGKTYVSSGEGNGYQVKVRGQASKDTDYAAMQNQMQEGLGSVNINLSDSRQSLDRKWLQDTINGYMDRGYAGGE